MTPYSTGEMSLGSIPTKGESQRNEKFLATATPLSNSASVTSKAQSNLRPPPLALGPLVTATGTWQSQDMKILKANQ